MSSKILVVEDNKETLALVRAALEEAGHEVICHDLLSSARKYLKGARPDMIVLDINLPDGDGVDLAAEVRRDTATRHIPVIMLTGQEGLSAKKRAFTAGADQYLTKPIEVDELLLWVNSLLRRVDLDRETASPAGLRFKLGDLEIDKAAYLVKFQGVVVYDLTRREFELLCCLAEHSPKVLGRDFIIAKAWRTDASENLVDAHIHNLRKKLPERIAVKIQSVSGKGFRYF